MRVVDGLGQTVIPRGSGTAQGGRFGPPGFSLDTPEMFGLGQTVIPRGSGTAQGGRFGPPGFALSQEAMFGLGQGQPYDFPSQMLAPLGQEDLFGLGQTVIPRGSGTAQGGRFGPPGFVTSDTPMFGLGQVIARGSGTQQGGRFGPPGFPQGRTDLFGMGFTASGKELVSAARGADDALVAILAVLGITVGMFVANFLGFMGAGVGSKVAPLNIKVRS